MRLLLMVLLLAPALRAELKPAALFSDHAVLQAGVELPVWGWADAGREVQVRIGDAAGTTKAAVDGRWSVKLPPIKASATPVEITIVCGEEMMVIRDVLLGEVWLGSGQSNMAMAMQRTSDAADAIAAAQSPTIRLFTVARRSTTRPANDVEGEWVVCSPETVKDFSAVLYHFGRSVQEELDVPVGLIHSSWGGTPIQAWMPRDAFAGGDDEIAALRQRIRSRYPSTTMPATSRGARRGEHLEPTRLFNGMIAPIIPYAIRGVTWYQGENNVHQGDVSGYAAMLEAMVRTWREQWGQGDWPFLYVQLAPYGKYKADEDALPLMWQHQMMASKLITNSGMAATLDVGDATDIHPKQKRVIGERLAAMALARTYGIKGITCDAPMARDLIRQDNKIRIRFDGASGGLSTNDGKAPSGFELAGAGGEFVAASALIDGEDVIVWSDQVREINKIRFCWSATPQVNLVNRAGLPAVPFRFNTE